MRKDRHTTLRQWVNGIEPAGGPAGGTNGCRRHRQLDTGHGSETERFSFLIPDAPHRVRSPN